MIENKRKTIKETIVSGSLNIGIDVNKVKRVYTIQNLKLGRIDEESHNKFKLALDYASDEWVNTGLSTLFRYDDDWNELGTTFSTTNCNGYGIWKKTTGFKRPEVIIGDNITWSEDANNNIVLKKMNIFVLNKAIGY